MSFKAGDACDKYDSIGDDLLRPPVPGGESKSTAMTEGYPPAPNSNYRDSAVLSMASGCDMPTVGSSEMASYLRWAQSFSDLLADREGVTLFKRFVEQEGGIHQDRLKFFLACDGLADVREPEKIKQMIDAIYKFLKRTHISVPDVVRDAIRALRKNELEPRTDIFDKMYEEVRHTMAQTIYKSFLKSDIYLEYVQCMTSTNSSMGMRTGLSAASSLTGSHSSSSSSSAAAGASGGGPAVPLSQPPHPPVTGTTPTLVTSSAVAANSMVIAAALGADHLTRNLTLPTLHEDSELVCDNIVSISASTHLEEAGATDNVGDGLRKRGPAEPPMRLTKDSLLATEARRLEIRPQGLVA